MAKKPSRFNEAARARFIEMYKRGATKEHAAAYAGVSRRTVYAWITEGEKEGARGAKKEFAEAVLLAEGERVHKWLGVIDDAMADSWQAAAWKLERLYKETYGRNLEIKSDNKLEIVITRDDS